MRRKVRPEEDEEAAIVPSGTTALSSDEADKNGEIHNLAVASHVVENNEDYHHDDIKGIHKRRLLPLAVVRRPITSIAVLIVIGAIIGISLYWYFVASKLALFPPSGALAQMEGGARYVDFSLVTDTIWVSHSPSLLFQVLKESQQEKTHP